jgi:hypothetical protein
MYDFIDRPVTDLGAGGRFIIWSTRSWVAAVGDNRCPASAIAAYFQRWDMLAGLQPFLRIMALFNRHGLHSLQFCDLRCNHISEHEAIILSLICSLRDGRHAVVRRTLDHLVEEEVVGDLILAFSGLGGAMAAAAIPPAPPSSDLAARQAIGDGGTGPSEAEPDQ